MTWRRAAGLSLLWFPATLVVGALFAYLVNPYSMSSQDVFLQFAIVVVPFFVLATFAPGMYHPSWKVALLVPLLAVAALAAPFAVTLIDLIFFLEPMRS
jgi:hypothetical protein